MKEINNKRKQKNKRFTLIELIIVIVVIGILAGMALPKFIGVVRDAKVATLIQDMDVIKNGIIVYNNRSDDGEDYPFVDNNLYTLSEKYKLIDVNDLNKEVVNIISDNGYDLNEDEVYEIDMDKLYKEDIQRIKNKDKTFYYAIESDILFINEPIKDGEGNNVFGPDISNEDKVDYTIPQNYVWGKYKVQEDKDIQPDIEVYNLKKADGSIIDLSGDPNLFDGNVGTGSANGLITINKDLAGNTITFNNYYRYSDSTSTFQILDENQEVLSFFDLVTNNYTKSLTVGGYGYKGTVYIALPNNAKYIKYSGNGGSVCEVGILNNSSENIITNISNKTIFQSNNITWDVVPNSKGYFLYYDNEFCGFTTGNSFGITYDKSKKNQEFTIVPVSNNNTINLTYKINLEKVPEILEGTKTLFDNNINTGVSNSEIQLLQDLTGKTIKMKNGYRYSDSTVSISILDENNQPLPFIECVSNKVTTNLSVGGYGYKGDVYFVIPPNAKKIKFTGVGEVREVSVLNKKNDVVLNDLKQEIVDQSVKISFNIPSNVKGSYIYYNNKFYNYTTTNEFYLPYDENAESQRVEIIPIDNENNTSTVYYFDLLKPKKYLLGDLKLFDKNNSTFLTEGSVKFSKDLTNKKVKIIPSYPYSSDTLTFNVKDLNGKNLEFNHTINETKTNSLVVGGYGNRNPFSIILPENAHEITFTSQGGRVVEMYLELN